MGKLIDSDKLKAHYAWWKDGKYQMTLDEAKTMFDTIIDLQPLPNVEIVQHGYWEHKHFPIEMSRDDDVPWLIMKCSVCGVKWHLATDNPEPPFAYCPSCGSKMDMKKGEDNA